jgi:hypothetical protein
MMRNVARAFLVELCWGHLAAEAVLEDEGNEILLLDFRWKGIDNGIGFVL